MQNSVMVKTLSLVMELKNGNRNKQSRGGLFTAVVITRNVVIDFDHKLPQAQLIETSIVFLSFLILPELRSPAIPDFVFGSI